MPRKPTELDKAGRKAIKRMQYWDGIFALIDSYGPRFEYDSTTDPNTGITTLTPKPIQFKADA